MKYYLILQTYLVPYLVGITSVKVNTALLFILFSGRAGMEPYGQQKSITEDKAQAWTADCKVYFLL